MSFVVFLLVAVVSRRIPSGCLLATPQNSFWAWEDIWFAKETVAAEYRTGGAG